MSGRTLYRNDRPLGYPKLARPPGSITTPDLFSTCYNGTTPIAPHQNISVPNNFIGSTYPKTGSNYMGFLLKYGSKIGTENLQVQLISPLVSNQMYLCGFNIQRADSSQYHLNSLEFDLAIEQCPTDCSKMINTSNIFSPNGDGINDFFEFTEFPINSLEIYNRWGNYLFRGENNSKWDGDNAPDGVYFYRVGLECDNETHSKTGFVQLIR